MAGNPRVVAPEGGRGEITITWDGQPQRLTRGQVIDVPAGSPLEEAIGAGNLVPLAASAAQGAEPVPVSGSEAVAEEEAPREEAETPAQPRSKKNGAAKAADAGTADDSSGEEGGK